MIKLQYSLEDWLDIKEALKQSPLLSDRTKQDFEMQLRKAHIQSEFESMMQAAVEKERSKSIK